MVKRKTDTGQTKSSSKHRRARHNNGANKSSLYKLQELRRHEAGPRAKALTIEDIGMRDNVTEVKQMDSKEVSRQIEKLVVQAVESILNGRGFKFQVPSRTTKNQVYIPELDRIALKNENYTERNFMNTSQVKKTVITTRVMELLYKVLRRQIHVTKRDLFYTDVKLFVDQAASDGVLDDVACMLGCTRTSLNVVASEKGIVVGRLRFRDDGDLIDCSRMGVGGKAIPPFIDRMTNFESDAEFILLVEKDAAFMRLAEDRFYNQFPCIIITAKGQPDVASRMFLKRLREELKIPVLALVDSDPYGLKILSVYMSGSKNMSYDAASLTTSGIKWLGVRPTDLDTYNIPEQCRLDMSETDIKTGKAMLQEEFVQKNPAWVEELNLMIKTKKKAEIQALSSFGFQYLTNTYLPEKIKKGDWI